MNPQLVMLMGPAMVLSVGVIIGIVMLIRRRQKRKVPATPQEQSASAYVYHDKKCQLEQTPLSDLEPLGSIRRRFGTKLVHLLEKNKSGNLQTLSLDPLRKDKNITPGDLYGAIHWKTQVALFKVDITTLQKIKVAMLIALAGIVLLGLFLIVAAMFGD